MEKTVKIILTLGGWTDDTYRLELTESQIRLLNWLEKEGVDMSHELNSDIKFEKI